ncbi:hypothetical protein [Cesiribacter andamanensis]|uniref:Uncharacterized protein n=1 Tax=Cesiribacter andamanensis AMV16 TaxID=1279009 RepID=M7NVH3_9BACT|nr:hypothetical protein [Cesiribacter andamanensis]EMR02474.1 hypothetical protein ADICEAN_02405 [Cesiribacter andamanensis AMV16]
MHHIDPYLLGRLEQGGDEVRWGYVHVPGLDQDPKRTFSLSDFQQNTAQRQWLSENAFSAEMFLKIGENQRSPTLFSRDYMQDSPEERISYLLPAATDIAAFMLEANWDAGKTNSFGMGAYTGLSIFNQAVSSPKPVSVLELHDNAYRTLDYTLANEEQATVVLSAWYDHSAGEVYREF